ncbi:hypothetical protein QOZ80_6AG0515060 [Eleusine coracana subsp. coracana]|nr:hypothetical protein QOZ80_6AG0515060 [Eleusine coracana subsp. coracana]
MCTGPLWSYICHRTGHYNRLLSKTITLLLVIPPALFEMGAYHPHKHKTSSPKGSPGYFVPKPVCAWLVFGFLSLALLHIICCSPSTNQDSVFSPLIQYLDDTYSFVSTEPKNCSYSEGKWVYAPGHARRYNGTLCNVKESHDCIRNGRQDTGYLDWRWQPDGCRLPAFNPRAFLSQMRGKHVAFVGDSMARNQVQSLVCLLSSAHPYKVVYRDRNPYKYYFWRWSFPSHDVTVSFYWAPFISRATGKASNDSLPQTMNYVDLDVLDDRWANDADTMDVVVFSIGHWLLNGAIYYNGTEMVGVHQHPEITNTTVVGYAIPMRTAYRKAFERLMTSADRRPKNVVLATFSPAHFEGNTLTTACPRKEPYKEGEKQLRPLEEELRTIMYEEAEAAMRKVSDNGGGGAMSVEVLDITKLAIMRPDGHPGPYMHRDPFANGVQEWMSADCLHFCLPGPVDTFNEILQQMLRKKRAVKTH